MIYITSFNSDLTFTGTGEYLQFTTELVGKAEPVSRENPDGCLIVYFKAVSDGLVDLLFKGLYDPDRDTIEGETASYEGYDVDSIDSIASKLSFQPDLSQSITFARARPPVTRFRYLLEESKENPSLNLARRRWVFATQATLFQAQTNMRSIKIIRRGLQDRQSWFKKPAVSVSNDPELDRMEKEMVNFPPENVRLYASLFIYLLKRRANSL